MLGVSVDLAENLAVVEVADEHVLGAIEMLGHGPPSGGPIRQMFREAIPTCSVMLAVMHWRTRGTTRGRFRPTSGTRTSSTRRATPNCRRRGSRTSGAELKVLTDIARTFGVSHTTIGRLTAAAPHTA